MPINVPEIFASEVFNDSVMRKMLPADVYEKLRKTIEDGKALDLSIANEVAKAMKEWAIEKGATHYTHWFQPMTGITAEKHDSFITPASDGKVIMDFRGKELVKGEPDASSFPSGGLRATFEARGYTAWDPTSYAFIKDDTLCIPTAFCSYMGEALDKKTPLLRSMEVVSKQAKRILHLLGKTDVKKVTTTVGAEQEYFLIDKDVYLERKDLIYTGRTLFGAKAPKGQELDDHYFGTLKPRVSAFMKDLDKELWKFGILSKTKHNEVAPGQHEMAPIFTTTNVSADHNQLTMELMKKIADDHNLACLLHEKPFAGVNGSGKHNNWSMSTDTGENLLNPTDNPAENYQFLLFLSAVIKAVDKYQDLLRISVASAGNDHRLGANEAPPAILSMFIGDDLEGILKSLVSGDDYSAEETKTMVLGSRVLANFKQDSTDRNRTSPFAFTGNKFEFRMLGSSASIACSNMMINTAVASVLDEYACILEQASDIDKAVKEIIIDTVKKHGRIIFNGNNYSDEWIAEAQKRGLHNLKSTAEALPRYVDKENVELFEKYHVLTETEIRSRCEILEENYCKVVNIEALTMIEMVKKDIIPAVVAFSGDLTNTALGKKALSDSIDCSVEENLIKKISSLTSALYSKVYELEDAVNNVKDYEKDIETEMFYYHDTITVLMSELRTIADELESLTGSDYWPYPTYGDLLFSVL